MDRIESLKEEILLLRGGSKIHIKEKNRGKFTKSAKAAGEGVQEHAHKVLNDPNATTLQKKRAQFAINAKKWAHKHQSGGSIQGLVYTPFVPQESAETESKEFTAKDFWDAIKESLGVIGEDPNYPIEHVDINQKRATENITASADNKPKSTSTTKTSTKTGTGKQYSSAEKEVFKQELFNAYYNELTSRGLDSDSATEFAKRFVTQDALESNWGQSSLSKVYNFGGIKDFSSNGGTQRDTVEYINGVKKTMKQPFAVYNNLPEYIKAKLAVVSRWDVLNHDPKEYFTRIVSGKMKYATDPNYASKLTNFHKQVWHE